jgi:hypothetical protein
MTPPKNQPKNQLANEPKQQQHTELQKNPVQQALAYLKKEINLDKRTGSPLDHLKNIVGKGLDQLAKKFEEIIGKTAIGNWILGSIKQETYALDPKKNVKEIDQIIREGNFGNFNLHQLRAYEGKHKGILALFFLKTLNNKHTLPDFQIGETYLLDLSTNPNAKHLDLTEIIHDDEVSMIQVESQNGTKKHAKRVYKNGIITYIPSHKNGKPLKNQNLKIKSGDKITIINRTKLNGEEIRRANILRQVRFIQSVKSIEHELSEQDITRDAHLKKTLENVAPSSHAAVTESRKAWLQTRKETKWSTACWRIATKTRKRTHPSAQGLKTPYYGKKDGQMHYPKSGNMSFDRYGKYAQKFDSSRYDTGLDAPKMIKELNLPIGTVFHIAAKPEAQDYPSRYLKNSPHWFTFVGFDKQGAPLFSDQGGYAVKKVFRSYRKLLAIY